MIIHAGFPKTGTTALQARLRHNEQKLYESGILYPRSSNNAHHKPASALVNRKVGWDIPKTSSSDWEQFVESLASTKAETILISSEFFAGAKIQNIKQIRKDLPEFKIEIIFTLRSLNEIIPSIYQQNLKKGLTHTYPEWITKKFMSTNGDLLKKPKLINHAEVISRWASIFGEQNLTLVMGDSSNPHELFRNFEECIGVSNLEPSEKRLNRSLTIRESEILRQVNMEIRSIWSWRDYQMFVRKGFVKQITDHPSDSREKFQTPAFLFSIVDSFAEQQVQMLKKLNIRVLGNLDLFLQRNAQASEVAEATFTNVEKDVKETLNRLQKERQKYNSLLGRIPRKLRSLLHR